MPQMKIKSNNKKVFSAVPTQTGLARHYVTKRSPRTVYIMTYISKFRQFISTSVWCRYHLVKFEHVWNELNVHFLYDLFVYQNSRWHNALLLLLTELSPT